VRFAGDRLIRFEAKVGDVVVVPTSAEPGKPEPYPFGAALTALMEARGLTLREVAFRCRRAESTIRKTMRGGWVPPRALVVELAGALDIPEQDLLAIAGPDAG
jgi:hypothetical protein